MLDTRPSVARLEQAARGGSAFVAALALLLQVLFAAPMGLRMAADALASGTSVTICTQKAGGHGQPAPHQPAIDHAHCPLCHAQGVPIVPVPPRLLLLVVLAGAFLPRPRAMGPPAAQRRFEPYVSRAPPALA